MKAQYRRIIQDLKIILRILKENPGMIPAVAESIASVKIDLVLREWRGENGERS